MLQESMTRRPEHLKGVPATRSRSMDHVHIRYATWGSTEVEWTAGNRRAWKSTATIRARWLSTTTPSFRPGYGLGSITAPGLHSLPHFCTPPASCFWVPFLDSSSTLWSSLFALYLSPISMFLQTTFVFIPHRSREGGCGSLKAK